MIIDLYQANNNPIPRLECSGRTKKIVVCFNAGKCLNIL